MGLRALRLRAELRAELRASRDALCVVLARMWVGAVVLLTGRVAGVAKASKTWVKANVVQPVQELLGLSEGARRRKGQVEEFMNGIGGDTDLHSLSQLLQANLEGNLSEPSHSVEIVDINSKLNTRRKSASGPRAHPGPRAKSISPTTDPPRGSSWLKKQQSKAKSMFARCTNREAVDDDDTFRDSDSSDNCDITHHTDYTDFDPEARRERAEARSPVQADEDSDDMPSWALAPAGMARPHAQSSDEDIDVEFDAEAEEEDATRRAFRGFGLCVVCVYVVCFVYVCRYGYVGVCLVVRGQ